MALGVSLFAQSVVLTGADVHFLQTPSFEAEFAPTEAPVSGEVRVACTVESSGWLRQCRTLDVSDDRLSEAFAEAAKGFRIGPETRSGEPTAGRSIEVVVRWSGGE